MSSLREALLEYQNSLEELTFNSKPIISMLTMVAAEFAETADGPPNVVEIIFKRVKTVDIKQKLPVLYLIDSICKNIGKPFTELFEKKIIDTFKHVFEEGDEVTRASLYKLRKTWIGIFSDHHLHEIDSAAQSIDPAWPSIPNSAPPPVKRRKENLDSTSATTKPKGPSGVSSALPTSRRKQASKPSTAPSVIPPNRKSLTESSKKVPLPTSSKSVSSAFGTQDRDYRKEISSSLPDKKRQPGLTPVPPQTQIPSQTQAQVQTIIGNILPPATVPSSIMATIPPSQQTPIGIALPVPVQAPVVAPLATISNFASSLNHQSPIKPAESIPPLSKDIGQQYVQVDGNTVKLFFLDENTSIVLMKGSPHMSLNELVKTNPYDLEPRLIMFEGKPTKVYIDSDKNGSKDFVILDFNSKQTFFNGEHAQSIKLGGPCREIILNGKPYQASFGGPPIDVQFLGDTYQTHTLRLGGPPPRVKISEDIRVDLWTEYVKKITGQSDEVPMPAVQTSYSSLPPTQSPYPPSILGTSPSSSLLLPQPTSALVPPTAPGLVPGLVTNPTVAISAPISAAALPSGLNPLQPSLPVTLPLQAPVPVPGATLPSAVPAPSIEPQVDPGDLFTKLISFGFIKATEPQITDSSTPSITTSVSANVSTIGSTVPLLSTPVVNTTSTATESSAATTVTTSTVNRTDSPSVLSRENGLNSLDEIESEPLLLETKSLKADHPKVIADLINGTQCPNCSLRFEVGDKDERSKYSVHLDWHFRLNRQERTDSKSKSAAVRRWFCPLDLWVSFKEFTDETDETNLDTELDDNDSDGEKKVCTVSAYEDESLNECAVCKERFETTWNEDEEEWQLLNAVKGSDDKIYHPLCLEDLMKQRAAEAEAAVAAAAAAEAAAAAAEADAATKANEAKIESEIPSGQVEETPMDQDNEIPSPGISVKTEEPTQPSEGGGEGGNSEIKEEEDEKTKEEDVKEENMGEEEGENSSNRVVKEESIESENETDEDLAINEDFTIYPPVVKGRLETSICSIS